MFAAIQARSVVQIMVLIVVLLVKPAVKETVVPRGRPAVTVHAALLRVVDAVQMIWKIRIAWIRIQSAKKLAITTVTIKQGVYHNDEFLRIQGFYIQIE